MDFLFIDAKYKGEIMIDEKSVAQLKKYRTIALYSSVQFLESFQTVRSALQSAGVKVITSKPKRASAEGQLLGCDVFSDSLRLLEKPDAYLYIGDGAFHPSALLLSQKESAAYIPVYKYNPAEAKLTMLKPSDFSRMLKRYRGSLLKLLDAKIVGVIVSTKQGQEQFSESLRLKTVYPDKNIYFFATNELSVAELENFPFVEVWVNSACPRIGFEDAAEKGKSIVNLTDALKTREILGKKSMLSDA